MSAARRKKPARAGPRPKPRSKRKPLRWPLIVAGLVGTLVACRAVVWLWETRPGPGSGTRQIVDWPEGLDASASADRLARLGLVSSPRLFSAYLRFESRTFEPGLHVVNDRLSPRALVLRLSRSSRRPLARVVIPEGFNQLQIAARLEELEICPAAAFRRAVADGLDGGSAEGFLFPATYELGVDTRPERVVSTMLDTFANRFAALSARHPGALDALARDNGFGRRELVTLASIVEKETARPDEKPLVASVYLNRLTDPSFQPARMLQADPTAGYGCALEPSRAPSCAGYDGRVTPAMLRDPANRYNTYKHAGLPPGPIANPGTSALEAVLAPTKTEYLFFVAVGGGRHKFSRTLEDHNRAINER